MSFVSNLRMRNLFPMNSDLGSANVDLGGGDPMQEVINAYNLQRQNEQQFRNSQPNGMRQVGNAGRQSIGEQSTLPEPMRFGGVTGQSNPGADILNRSRQNAERIYASYGEPAVQAEQMGPSNDDIYMDQYFKRKNAETTANANADVAKDRLRIAQQNADSKGWRTVTITDPKDPSRQINARVNDISGEVKPIELPGNGVITRMGSAKDIQTDINNKNLKVTQRQAVKDKAQAALDELNILLNSKSKKLTDVGSRSTGWTSFGNFIPGSKGLKGKVSAERLKNLITLDLMGELKAQSKTGATGFGQMNLKELGVLEGGASKLSTMSVDDADYEEELNRVGEKLNKILQDGPDDSVDSGTNIETEVSDNTSINNTPQAPTGFEYVRRPDNKGWTAIRKVGK